MEGAPNYKPFDTPLKSMASCFLANGSWNMGGGRGGNDGCTFNQFAGELWNARSHQSLLANGIAVVQLNPYTSDTWEWYTPDLPIGGGLDQPYFAVLFEMMKNGSYANLGAGVLDVSKLIVSGYSSGAQMASWMINLQGHSALPSGVNIAAAVMYSGGSRNFTSHLTVACDAWFRW